jgi:hypothetical protein
MLLTPIKEKVKNEQKRKEGCRVGEANTVCRP